MDLDQTDLEVSYLSKRLLKNQQMTKQTFVVIGAI